MQAATIREGTYYRCLARTLAPGSEALSAHPRTVNVREDHLLTPLNAWIGGLFSRTHRDRTVAALVSSQDGFSPSSGDPDGARARLTDAEQRLRRFQSAIGAGVDPTALVDVINQAQAERAAARAELDQKPHPALVSAAEVHAMVDSLGDVGAALGGVDPDRMGRLYERLGVELRFEPDVPVVHAAIAPRVVSECVRGGT